MTQTAPAGWYPDPENPTQQRYWNGVAWTRDVMPDSSHEQAPHELAGPEGARRPVIDAPVLRAWKTSVGFSVLGLFFGTPLLMTLSFLLGIVPMILLGLDGTQRGNGGPELLGLIGNLLMLGYAVAVYPSYFSQKPRLRSSKAISFANIMFGGLIFGLLWNGNLSKKIKGSSYIVAAVFSGLTCLLLVFNISMALLYGGTSSSTDIPSKPSADLVPAPPPPPVFQKGVQPLERTEDANIYTDADTGASFVIPDTWSEKPFFVSEQGRKVKFRVPGDGGTAFYTSVSLSPEDPRQGMDDWSDEDISRLAGRAASDVTVRRVTLNDVEYFLITARELNTDNVKVMHIRNGDVYGFQYVEAGNEIDNEALQAFYSMVESMVYP